MSSLSSTLLRFFIVLCFLLTLIKVLAATVDIDDDDDDELFQNLNKPHKRKSARMAFLEETDDPMFKFLTKILNTAQLRTKNRLARAQNGMRETQELKTDVTNKLKHNNLPLMEYV